MNASELKHRITIYKASRALNGPETYSPVRTVWASYTAVSDSEKWRQGASERQSVGRFVIRKLRDLDLNMGFQVEYKGAFYDIIGAKEVASNAQFIEITAQQVHSGVPMPIPNEPEIPVEPPYIAPFVTVPSEIILENGVLRLVDGQYAGEFTHVTRTLSVVRDAGLTDLTSLIVDGVFSGELDVVGSTSVFTFETVAHGKRGEAVRSVATIEIEPRYIAPYVITAAGIVREADDRLVTTPATFGGAVQSVTHELTMTLLEEVTIITPILFDGVLVGEMEHVEGPTRYDFVSTAYGDRQEIVTSSASIEVEQKYVPIAVKTETELALVDGKLRITPATFTKNSAMWGVRLFKMVDGSRVSVSHELDESYVYQGNFIFPDDTVFIAETFAFGDRQEQAVSYASYTVAKRDPVSVLKTATITRDGDTLTVSRTEFGGDVVSIDTSWTRVVSGVTEDLVLPADGVFAPAAIHRAGAVYNFTATATGMLGDTVTDTATIDIEAFYIAPREVAPSRIENFSGQTLTFITGAISGDVERFSERFFVIVNGEQTDISAQVAEAKVEYALNWNDQTFVYQFVAHAFDGSEVVSEARYTVPAYIPISLKTPGRIVPHDEHLEFNSPIWSGDVLSQSWKVFGTVSGNKQEITDLVQNDRFAFSPSADDRFIEIDFTAVGQMGETLTSNASYTIPAIEPIVIVTPASMELIDDTIRVRPPVFSGPVDSTEVLFGRTDGVTSEILTDQLINNLFAGPAAVDVDVTYIYSVIARNVVHANASEATINVAAKLIGPVGSPINERSGNWESIVDGGVDWRLGVFEASDVLWVNREVELEYLMIAGGGGAPVFSNDQIGGGGAGGVLRGSVVLQGGSYALTIGQGGFQPESETAHAVNGTDTVAFGLTAVGGGKGGSPRITSGGGITYHANAGGSGGGAAGRAGATSGSGVAGQGFGPGPGGNYNHPVGGSGGGSAGRSHVAGDGLRLSFTGTPEWYAVGGCPGHSNANGPYQPTPEWLLSRFGSGGNGGAAGRPVMGRGLPGVCMVRYRLGVSS